jgi:hypothetical protein
MTSHLHDYFMSLVQRANKLKMKNKLKNYRFQTMLKQAGSADQTAGILDKGTENIAPRCSI